MAASRDGDFILISARKGSFLVLNSFNAPALQLNLLAVCKAQSLNTTALPGFDIATAVPIWLAKCYKLTL